MDLSKIIAISGKSGLYKIVSQSKGGLIAESLTDEKKIPVFATDRSSVLEDISMFTYGDDVPLKKVLWNMFEKEEGKKATVDPKADGSKLREYFESVLQDHDKERVYTSDIKKVIAWYNQLVDHNLITPIEETDEEGSEEKSLEEGAKKADKRPDVKNTSSNASRVAKPVSKSASAKNTNTKQSKKS
jgi:hypothetical protein